MNLILPTQGIITPNRRGSGSSAAAVGGGAGGSALADTTFAIGTALPAGWLEAGDGTLDDYGMGLSRSGGFVFNDGSYDVTGGTPTRAGILSPNLYSDAGADIDVQLTFKWLVAADTVSEVFGIALCQPDETNWLPGAIGVCSDRNFNRILPSRYLAHGSSLNWTIQTLNNTNLHTLAGGELTADDSTTHTMGFSVVTNGANADMTTYFDGVVQKATFQIGTTEKAIFDLSDRVGIFTNLGIVSSLTCRWASIRIAPAGTIYT